MSCGSDGVVGGGRRSEASGSWGRFGQVGSCLGGAPNGQDAEVGGSVYDTGRLTVRGYLWKVPCGLCREGGDLVRQG